MADFATRRTIMVDTQVRPSDVTKYPIIDAMLSVPREAYVPDACRAVAYAESELDLGGGRMILAPRAFAKLLEMLDLDADDVVLDLGCGLGYSSAVLARMARAVVAVEPDETLAAEAQATLSAQGHDNVAVVTGALNEGAASSAPYDAIVVQGAITTWPEALSAQLNEGGQIAAIWAEGHLRTARLGRKINGVIQWRDAFSADASILPDFVGETAFAF